MSDIISIDHEKMQQISQQLGQEAAKVKKVIGDLNQQIATLKAGGWIADAANKFYQDMDNQVMPRINRLQGALDVAAQKLGNELPKAYEAGCDEAVTYFPTAI
jgi:WXG100 family type VII secretion target